MLKAQAEKKTEQHASNAISFYVDNMCFGPFASIVSIVVAQHFSHTYGMSMRIIMM